jgi:hypothetical protein
LTRKKGDKAANARPGNKNSAKGPRLGRKDKPVTNDVAAPALPQPRAGAKLGRSPHRARGKTGGKDFEPGTNSHDGTVFRGTKDQLPRGNGTLMLRIGYHDFRDKIYDSIERLVGTPMGALLFMREFIDRTEGRSVKKIEKTTSRESNFYLMTRDNQKQPMFPDRQAVGAGNTPTATSAEDELILGVVRVGEDERA